MRGRFFPAQSYRALLEALYPQTRAEAADRVRPVSTPRRVTRLLREARSELAAWSPLELTRVLHGLALLRRSPASRHDDDDDDNDECASWTAAWLQCAAPLWPRFDGSQLVTAGAALAQLLRGNCGGPGDSAALEQWATAVLGRLEDLHAGQLTLAVHVAGQLGVGGRAMREMAQGAMGRVEEELEVCSGEQLAQLLQGAARLRLGVSSTWAQRWAEALKNRPSEERRPQMAGALWALAALRLGRAGRESGLLTALAEESTQHLDGREMAQAAYAWGRLGRDERGWWREWERNCWTGGREYNARELSQIMWARGRLGHGVGEDEEREAWCRGWEKAAVDVMAEAVPQGLANMVYGLAGMAWAPQSKAFWLAWGQRALLVQQGFTEQGLSNSLFGLARCAPASETHLPRTVVSALCAVLLPLLPSLSDAALHSNLVALSHLSASPPPLLWFRHWASEALDRLHRLPPDHLASLLPALARLELGPAALGEAFFRRLLEPLLALSSAASLSFSSALGLVPALVRLNVSVSSAEALRLASFALPALQSSSAEPLLVVRYLSHLPRLELSAKNLPASLVTAALVSLRPKLARLPPQLLSRALWALQQLEAPVPASWLRLWTAAALQAPLAAPHVTFVLLALARLSAAQPSSPELGQHLLLCWNARPYVSPKHLMVVRTLLHRDFGIDQKLVLEGKWDETQPPVPLKEQHD